MQSEMQNPEAQNPEHVRMVEALLFAAAEPLDEASLAARLPEGTAVGAILAQLRQDYEPRGINLVRRGDKWMLRTAPDLAFLLQREVHQQKRLSRAATETLAIIAYHQPVTRAEIEEVRGVAISKGTIDVLLATGWVRPVGRRRSPGRPVTYGTADEFLVHFGLESIKDLPGMEELKAAGLLDPDPPADFMATPDDAPDAPGADAPAQLPLEDEPA
jgi:segregation and condensation protein B